MTDRVNALVVALTHDHRTDDVEALITAIKQLRGVINVSPHVADISDYVAQSRVRQEIGSKLIELIYPAPGK